MERFGAKHQEKPTERGEQNLDAHGLQAKLKEAIVNFYHDDSGKVVPEKAIKAAVLASAMTAAIPMAKVAMTPNVQIAESESAPTPTRIRIAPKSTEKLSKQEKQKMREAYTLSQEDNEALGLVVYREAGAEPPIGKLAVAQVVINRFLKGGHGETLRDVIFEHKGKRWQFDGVDDTQERTPAQIQDEAKELPEFIKVFEQASSNRNAKELAEALSEVTGLPLHTEYYKLNKLNEYDPHTKMSRKNKEFFQSLLKLKEIGNHGFYSEHPKESETPVAIAKIGNNVIPIPRPRPAVAGEEHQVVAADKSEKKIEAENDVPGKRRASRS